jgi:hypothetical protein
MQTLEMEKVYHVHNNEKYLGEFKTYLPIQEDTNEAVSVQIYKYLSPNPDDCHTCYYYYCGVVVEFHNIDNDNILYLTHENKKRNNTPLLKFSRKNSDEHVIVCYTLSGNNLYFKRDHSFYNKYQNQMEEYYSFLKNQCCYSKEILGETCIHSIYQDFLSLNIGDVISCKYQDLTLVTEDGVPLLITNIDKKCNLISCVNLYNQSIYRFRIFDISIQKNTTKLLCELKSNLSSFTHFLLPPNITKLT